MSEYKGVLKLNTSTLLPEEEKIIFTSVGKNISGRKDAKMVYFPQETTEYIKKYSAGSFSSAVLTLVDYAILDLQKKKIKIMSQSE